MAKKLEKQLLQIQESINGRLKKAGNLSNSFLNGLAKDLATQMAKRTRLGKGVNRSGKQYKLAPLKGPTVEERELYSVNLSPFTRPPKSHLTATGQLLDAISGKAKSKSLVIYIKENRKFDLNGSRPKSSHADMVKGLESGNLGNARAVPRPFFKVSNPERNGIIREVRKEVREKLLGLIN